LHALLHPLLDFRLARLGVLSSRTRNHAQPFPSRTIAVDDGNVSERQDADEALATIDDRQAPDLNVSHVEGDLLEVLVVKAVFDLGSHDVAHLGVRSLALSNAAIGDVAV